MPKRPTRRFCTSCLIVAEHVLGRGAFEEEEIALRLVLGHRHLAAIQPMRVGDDQALARLAIDLAAIRTTGTSPSAMTSLSTLPGPTDGN